MRLLLVGCGAMGSALLQGWMNSKEPFEKVAVISPHLENATNFAAHPQVLFYHAIEDVLETEWDAIVFAVKPKVLPEILPAYQKFAFEKTLFVSIAAAIPLFSIAKMLDHSAHCARVMPNTPVIANKGVCGLLMEADSSPEMRHQLESLFSPLGDTVWVETDVMLDVVTAVSGCGPAYIFLMIEALALAACDLGFSQEQALRLAKGTAWGAANYAHDTNVSPQKLRENVTSPGGMTEAALEILMRDNALGALMKNALQAALHRGEEIRSHGTAS